MNNWIYSILIFILGIMSFFTGEMVTFAMLGIVLIALTNIQSMLKELITMKKEEIKKQG